RFQPDAPCASNPPEAFKAYLPLLLRDCWRLSSRTQLNFAAMTTLLGWRREVTPGQWRAFLAAYLGWMLDGFDFTILTFLLVDIERSFTVNSALAGALGSVTLMFRLVGGIASGTAADRWGRKFPLMFSILWYSLFAFLGGFSTSYRMLFAIRALFGIGMGGVWAAGMPLAIEHWPPRLRGIVSGML